MENLETVYPFVGKATPPAVASPGSGPFVINTVGAAPPTATAGTNGLTLALTSASQAQNLCLYFGDVLSFANNELLQIEGVLALPVALGTGVYVIFGASAARNDDPDSIAGGAWFKLDASANVVCEGASGLAADLDDQATNETLATSFKRFKIDLQNGVIPPAWPKPGKGGLGNVLFSLTDLSNTSAPAMKRVCDRINFDISNYTAGFQPILQIGKASGAAIGSVTIKELVVNRRRLI